MKTWQEARPDSKGSTSDSFNAGSCTATSRGNGDTDACVKAVLDAQRPTYSAGPAGGPHTMQCQSFVANSPRGQVF